MAKFAKPKQVVQCRCNWCAKDILQGRPVYHFSKHNILVRALTLGIVTKDFCSERCRTRYKQSIGEQ